MRQSADQAIVADKIVRQANTAGPDAANEIARQGITVTEQAALAHHGPAIVFGIAAIHGNGRGGIGTRFF